ncbi:hypothetical protein ACG3SL_04575 [Sphingomonas sp. CJ20]
MTVPRPEIRDETSEDEFVALARDCRTVASQLADMGRESLAAAEAPSAPGTPLTKAAQVRRYLASRRLRESLLPAELFADPAWDMLLDLFASELEGTVVSVSSACIASGVPSTTALRWLTHLEKRGLVVRESDRIDGRRTNIRLTKAAREPLRQWLERAPWMSQPSPHR